MFKARRMLAALAIVTAALSSTAAAAAEPGQTTHYVFGPGSASLTDCLGEYGDPYVIENLIYRVTVVTHTSNDNTFLKVTETFTGVGQSDGVEYHGLNTFHTAQRIGQDGTTTFDTNVQSRLIAGGRATNWLIHQRFRATMTADGTFTVTHDSFSGNCSSA